MNKDVHAHLLAARPSYVGAFHTDTTLILWFLSNAINNSHLGHFGDGLQLGLPYHQDAPPGENVISPKKHIPKD